MSLGLVLQLEQSPWASPRDTRVQFEEVVEPLLAALRARPALKCGLVLSGDLAESWAQTQPFAIKQISELLRSSQVELLTTPHYAPMLNWMAAEDALDQIRAHLSRMRRFFGYRPQGVLIPHRVWDPILPMLLHRSGVKWCLISDEVVEHAGYRQQISALRVERQGAVVFAKVVDRLLSALCASCQSEAVAQTLAQTPKDRVACWTVRDVEDLDGLFEVLTKANLVLPSKLSTNKAPLAYLPPWAPSGLLPWPVSVVEELDTRLRFFKLSELSTRFSRAKGKAVDPDALVQARRYFRKAQSASALDSRMGALKPRIRQMAWREIVRADATLSRAMKWEGSHISRDELPDGSVQYSVTTNGARVTVDPRRSGPIQTYCTTNHPWSWVDASRGAGHVVFLRQDETLADAACRVDELGEWEVVETGPWHNGVRIHLQREFHWTEVEEQRVGTISQVITTWPSGRIEIGLEVQSHDPRPAHIRLMFFWPTTVDWGGKTSEIRIEAESVPLPNEGHSLKKLFISGEHLCRLTSTPGAQWRADFTDEGHLLLQLAWGFQLWGGENSRVRLTIEDYDER